MNATPRHARQLSAVATIAAVCASVAVGVPTASSAEPTTTQGEAQNHEKENGDWSVKLGFGAGVAPTYEGADDYELVPLPVVDIRWRDRLFIGTGGAGVNIIRSKHVRFGARLTYNGGRDQDDDDALRGLGDVDGTVEAGVFGALTYANLTLSGDLRQDTADGHEGLVGRAALTYRNSLSENLTGTIGPSITWADGDYMQSFFGVDAGQSARSGLSRFDASSGIKNYALNATLTYAMTDSWSVTGIARYARLAGDAADSPIIKDENQMFSGFHVAYQF